MSINGSDKERTFTFFQIMAEVLGFKMENIKLEKPYGKSKVDLFGVDPLRRLEIYVENQITSSDNSHLKKIVNLINGMNKGIIVWGAFRFNHEHLHGVKEELKRNSHKYIDFYAIQISEDVIEYVSLLNKQYKIHILNNLDLINQVEKPLKLVYKIEQIPTTFIGNAYIGKKIYYFNEIADLREYIMGKLQNKIPYFKNLHFEKRPTKYGTSISIGAGQSGLTYLINVKNRSEMAYAELHFDQSQKKLFKEFKFQLPSMQAFIHPDIEFKKRKIGVYFKPLEDLDKTIDKIGAILDRMIQYFSPYTYR